METTVLQTDLHCTSCINKIEPILESDLAISEYKFDLSNPLKTINIKAENLNVKSLIYKINIEGYSANKIQKTTPFSFEGIKTDKLKFWRNTQNWMRASFNTLNCLIGCSIGDFGMLIFLQAYYPETSMVWQMVLAIIAGLITSVALETIILKSRERFNWSLALKTALSMSFISMVGMEIAMNATDFMITGGQAAFNTFAYWLALVPAMLAGFILPLPYNYYKLEKHGKTCH